MSIFVSVMRRVMDKKIYNVTFTDIVNNVDKRLISKNGDVALLEFGDYDYQEIRALLMQEQDVDSLRCQYQAQFACVLAGSLKLELNGRCYDLAAHDVCCMIEGDYFKPLDASKDAHWFVIICRYAESLIQGLSNVMLLMSFVKKINTSRSFRMKEKTSQVVFTLYKLMREALGDEALAYRDAMVSNYLQILFYQLYSDLTLDEDVHKTLAVSRRDELLMRFTQLVSDNYKLHRKVSYYADKMCLTPKYLSTVVYEASGKYARDIIAEFVIMEAKRCLVNTTMTVQEIGDYLHFSCQSFFGKYFKEHAGMSPQAYRRGGGSPGFPADGLGTGGTGRR